jgi:hypothetical protein
MPTLKEQIAQLTVSKHRLAVWEALHAYLDGNFVARDGSQAQKALKVPDCMVEVVPEDVIEQILQSIGDGPIKELRATIDAIENREIEFKKGTT